VSHPDPTIPSYDGPPWVPFRFARDAHRAAFQAFVHAPTMCRLVLLWFPKEEAGYAGDGWFEWKVISPTGWERDAGAGEDPPNLFERAEATIRRMLQEIDEAQLGG
jgi:hypothetical protein